ncbi:preprotein translocase subunit SecE [Clostridium collagenovorans DSM 3089]|uniref:Protein translocase subunit SecE n=1 Tax=Clostridium collagenovorans DSM 3089 TaxID=1121306 RepID=A0A1M5YM06_9CLOT|nr:preprotein translocase subunit SecE [Clostridium collagenovorans]SHI13042.1 preprotein translocase subunit SecE [Clostridium collagenovorans DSM 3089]
MAVNGKVKAVDASSDKGMLNFFRGLKAEFKRITWPPKKDVKKTATAVIGFCVMYMILVGLLDLGFNNIFKIIFR